MSNKYEIGLHGASLNIVRQCGPVLKDVLQYKFGCEVQIDGVDFESDLSAGQRKRPTGSEKRFSVLLPSGVKVSVYKADLTCFQGDAVVNAANERLNHCGGLAQALSKAGGPQIQTESDDYIKKYGSLRTGEAVVTGAGSLPCQCIIHTVGPQLFSMYDLPKSKPLLEKAITSVLDKVGELHLKNVAIPAVSSGIFKYPLSECANTIVRTVKQYYGNPYLRFCPEEILLMNHDEPTVKEMERACHDILVQKKAEPRQSQWDSKGQPVHTVQLGIVHLILRKGKIEEQKTDVIVNTASPEQSPTSGSISRALFQRAGYRMQTELRNSPSNNNVVVTKPYKLDCKQVFHTHCSHKSSKDADKIFHKAVMECLWMAASKHYKSIAFPAIGTGNLGFSKEEAARIMTKAVIEFSQNCQMKMEVHFVIYPADTDTFKVFAAQIGASSAEASHPSSSPGFEHICDVPSSSDSASPQISLSSTCEETIREAERWLSDLLFNPSNCYIMSNNFIQHFGEERFHQLSRPTKRDVSIEEFFRNGCGGVCIKGGSGEDVAVVAVQIEAMFCEVQDEFVDAEVRDMQAKCLSKVSFERETVGCNSSEFNDRRYAWRHEHFRILKVERVANPTLEKTFDLNKKRLNSRAPQKMYQRIPAQFCRLVCHIGFHAEYAPPNDPAYGEGIYFADSVKTAMELWREPDEEYLYFVEADVLTGKTVQGKPGLIVPPAVGEDPFILYDSVSGGIGVAVIFSGYQALPKYIITCKRF
ncbi:protein mono-ADP-ribosyltransferase PARP14 isoform X2 [Thalassophryne amazonica]|uniref:protein mono-ADP-ribosyltransferase PARP14 isoform X2 n=1 Tax=Thalassophryne amazonica TaxID=390379 RepID=UPI001471ADB9|nr:protein mono-ADP-ribosyltransferase PARP14 isoform X2 [Thalassophryne amazonica]